MKIAKTGTGSQCIPGSQAQSVCVEQAALKRLVKRFSSKRVLVIGDLMLDQFIWGDATHISPEAPIPVVHVSSESFMPGGAANVVSNIAAIGGQVSVCGVIGQDHTGRQLKELLEDRGADTSLIKVSRSVGTIVKTRVIAQHQHIVRFDRDNKVDGDGAYQKQLLKAIKDIIHEVDAVILEDYGKGILIQPFVDELVALCKQQKKIVTADPKIDHYLDFSGVTLITPNFAEAVALSGVGRKDYALLPDIAARLHERWQEAKLLITLGEQGMYLSCADGSAVHIPTQAKDVFDVAGAGDTVIATITMALASGAGAAEAAAIANLAAGVVVGKMGTATVSQQELLAAGEEIWH